MPAENNRLLNYAEEALMGVFAKVAVVDVDTGSYEFVKISDELGDAKYIDSPDIYTYIRRQVADGLIYPEYAADYLRYSDPEYVKKMAKDQGGSPVLSYCRKLGDSFRWLTFRLITPPALENGKNVALFTWRVADRDTTTMFDAVSVLSVFYYKILRINLTTDRYETVKPDQYEVTKLKDAGTEPPEAISGWFKQFAEMGYVHEDDIAAYLEFTDIDRLRAVFKEDQARRTIRYRRLSPNGFRWVQMYLFPSVEYTDSNQVLTLYVRDVHEEHVTELRNREKLTKILERDALTLLFNRHKYQEDVDNVDKAKFTRLSIAYIDVNGLHEVNNHLGHDAGDNMLCAVADALKKYFPDERCYRIGGDEFVVLSVRLVKNTVIRTMADVRKELQKDNYEIAVGISSGQPEDKESLLNEAEAAMRADKAAYYQRHGDRRKRNQMNEELEKMITEKKDEEYFLKIISRRFAGVYFVNLNDGGKDVRHIFVPGMFKDLLVANDYDYFKSIKIYVDKYVRTEYRHFFDDVLNFENLAEVLRERGDVSFEYEKNNGVLIHLHILRVDEKNPTGPADDWDGNSIWVFEEGALDAGPGGSQSVLGFTRR